MRLSAGPAWRGRLRKAARREPSLGRPPDMMYILYSTWIIFRYIVSQEAFCQQQFSPCARNPTSTQSLDANPGPKRSDRSTYGPCQTISAFLALTGGGRRAAAYQYVTHAWVVETKRQSFSAVIPGRIPAELTEAQGYFLCCGRLQMAFPEHLDLPHPRQRTTQESAH